MQTRRPRRLESDADSQVVQTRKLCRAALEPVEQNKGDTNV